MNEAEDPEIGRWKRARSVIEHENTLVNNRVTWLLASQGFLIATYGALVTNWGKPELRLGPGNFVALVVALFAVSFYICLSIGIMLSAAIQQIKRTHCWWYGVPVTAKPKEIERASKLSPLNDRHPILQGWKARTHTRPFDTEFMPYFFLGGWIVLVFIAVLVAYPSVWTVMLNKLTRIFAVLGILAAAGLIAWVSFRIGKHSAEPDSDEVSPPNPQL